MNTKQLKSCELRLSIAITGLEIIAKILPKDYSPSLTNWHGFTNNPTLFISQDATQLAISTLENIKKAEKELRL